MNASIVIRIDDSELKIFSDYLPKEKVVSYGGDTIHVLDGLKNVPPKIASIIGNVGPSTITFGDIVQEKNELKLMVHSPAFDLIRDRLGEDFYTLKAFPAAPYIALARITDNKYVYEGSVNLFRGKSITVDSVTISDDHAWYEYKASLVGMPFSNDYCKSDDVEC